MRCPPPTLHHCKGAAADIPAPWVPLQVCAAVSGGYGASAYGASSGFGYGSGGAAAPPDSSSGSRVLSDPARESLTRATGVLRRYGWLSFWTQGTLSTVSGAILLFSVAFTTQVRAVGAVCAVLSMQQRCQLSSLHWQSGVLSCLRQVPAPSRRLACQRSATWRLSAFDCPTTHAHIHGTHSTYRLAPRQRCT